MSIYYYIACVGGGCLLRVIQTTLQALPSVSCIIMAQVPSSGDGLEPLAPDTVEDALEYNV